MTARAWLDNNELCISVPYKDMAAVEEIEPAPSWDPVRRALVAEHTPYNVCFVVNLFPDIELDDALTELVGERFVADPDGHWKTCDKADLPEVHGLPEGGWEHQRRAFWWARNKVSAYWEIGMGGGKTAITAAMIRHRGHRRVLIVCPKKVVPHWPAQLALYGVDDANVAAARDEPVAKRLALAQWALSRESGRAIVVLTYASLLNAGIQKLLASGAFDLVVLDEAQNIKAHNGQISKALWRALKKAKSPMHKLFLSGTSMPHSPGDIFAQYRVLDESIFGTAFTRFRARYAVMHPVLPTIKEWVRQEEMAAKMAPLMFRVGREVLDLPPVQHIVKTVTLGPKARKLYKEMADNFYAAVDEGEITASNALVKLLRLQTLAAGHLRLDTGETVPVDKAKQEMLAEILDELPLREKVVVFCRFRDDLNNIRQIAADHGRRYGEVSGAVDDLQDSKFPAEVDVLGVQIQAGGAGIDLSAAAYAVYYTVGFSLGDYEQSLARTHRPGQTRSVTYLHIQAEDTVDSRVYAALSERKNVVESVLRRVSATHTPETLAQPSAGIA